MLKEGDAAPEFKVLTDTGEEFDLAEHMKERKKFTKKGVTVLGVSPDTTKAQAKFKEKFDLNFTLLADADKDIANKYGVMKEKNMYGKKVMGVARTTFVIENGKIAKIFNNVKPEGHAEEVLAAL
jgi:peroxiredoxin Q/BCP